MKITPRLLLAVLATAAVAHITPLFAIPIDADWKLESLQNPAFEWWHTLTIKTVPGVVYQLQKSTTLTPGDWTNIGTTYGSGADWRCPLFRGGPPADVAASGPPSLPASSAVATQIVGLTLERTPTGEAVISWSSLDNHAPQRKHLTGVMLDAAWYSFNTGSLTSHGNYLYSVRPLLGYAVTPTITPTPLGTMDAAMVADFTSAFPGITDNIKNSVASAADYNPPPASLGQKSFYRFTANWNVDSDGDTRFDWQEILLDRHNPFAADSDGDGTPDQANPYPDSDGDGLSDTDELFVHHTDPNSRDSDSDGVSDDIEIKDKTNPNSSSSHGPVIKTVHRTIDMVFYADPNNQSGGVKIATSWQNYASPWINITTPIPPADLGAKLLAEAPFPETIPTSTDLEAPQGAAGTAGSSRWSGTTPSLHYSGSINQRRLWLQIAPAAVVTIHRSYMRVTERSNDTGRLDYAVPFHSKFALERVDVAIPEGKTESSPFDLVGDLNGTGGLPFDLYPLDRWEPLTAESFTQHFLAVEAAPEVLTVNSDFDEGRIDPTTGYAIPDCDDIPNVVLETGAGNTRVELDAVRNHLDGTFSLGQLVVDDLHPGWFGVPPQDPHVITNRLWAGANITIRKIDKIDDDTGYKESGQIRFYAKWPGGYYGITPYDFQTLQPVNLVSAGVNGRPGEGVYGENSTIPWTAKFYMEGVRPGKITLEWRYQKGTADVKYEQTFKVETRKSVADWQKEVRYQIRLQTKVKTGTEVDVALYDTGSGFRNTNSSQDPAADNTPRVRAIYYYYQQLFNQMPDKFMWAGMAKTAAAPIYAGMSDLTSWAWAQDAIPFQEYGTATQRMIKGLLLSGQKKIFEDMGWAHRAYMASGRWALDWVETQSDNATDFNAWRNLYSGIEEADQTKINIANGDLLRREQRQVVQDSYTSFATNGWFLQPRTGYNWLNNIAAWLLNFQVVAEDPGLGANVGVWLSANALRNPMPGGPAFRATVPNGRIDIFNDRWSWTNNSTNGMLQIWTGFGAGQRLSENNKTMYSGAASYSFDTGGLPIE